jgi:hypothetical protein
MKRLEVSVDNIQLCFGRFVPVFPLAKLTFLQQLADMECRGVVTLLPLAMLELYSLKMEHACRKFQRTDHQRAG